MARSVAGRSRTFLSVGVAVLLASAMLLVEPAGQASPLHSAQQDACSSGAHSLSAPGSRVYPEMGNGGYTSLHTDVVMVYDAPTNLFLPGNHVDLKVRSTQCLTDLSFDFERTNSETAGGSGPDMTVGSVTVNGQ